MIYKRILVAVDGSATSKAGLDEGIRLAKDQGAVLGLVHVVNEAALFQSPMAASASSMMIEVSKEQGNEVMRQVAADVRRQGLEPETQVVEMFGSRVADIIVQHVKNWKADLIVMGTHGRRGLSHMVMGSDAELTVRYSPVPVLLVRSDLSGG